MSAARPVPTLLLAALLAPGCVTRATMTLGAPLPSVERVAALEPGRTTRRECVTLLGPPEEWRVPVSADGARRFPVQVLLATEERDILDRRTFTWSREVRHGLTLLVWPFYRSVSEQVDHERLVVTFDPAGRVETVSRTDVEGQG